MRKNLDIRPGDVYPTRKGGDVVVLEYINNTNVLVKFLDMNGYEVWTSLSVLRKGLVRNLYTPYLFGVGYMGEGPHKSTDYLGKPVRKYTAWGNMIERCYSKAMKRRCPSYETATACLDWENFQNFAEWFIQQSGHEDRGWQLDKDLLGDGSKIYSPETCTLLPARLNILIKNTSRTNQSFILPEYSETYLPTGVSYNPKSKSYMISVSTLENPSKHKGIYFKTPFDAFRAYKEYKESLIKELAFIYKDNLSKKAYAALLELKVNF